ncbi:MAG: ABC transporter permease subunit [Candidatus Andersenbacteria bacterium]
MKRSRGPIYLSGLHLAATFALVVVPLVLLLVVALVTGISPAGLFGDIGVSTLRLLVAYVVAVVLAWVAAVAFYHGRRAAVALPIFDVLQSIPSFAALPFAVYLLGPSNVTVVLFLVLAVIWPIFFSVISSLKQVQSDWQDVARVTDLHGWRYLWYFLLPITLPGLVTGSIVGLGEGWEALVATEIIVGPHAGIGNFFQNVAHDVTATTLGILGLLVLIFSINKLIWLPLLERSHRLTED